MGVARCVRAGGNALGCTQSHRMAMLQEADGCFQMRSRRWQRTGLHPEPQDGNASRS